MNVHIFLLLLLDANLPPSAIMAQLTLIFNDVSKSLQWL